MSHRAAGADAAAPIENETQKIFGGDLPLAQALQKLRARLLDLSTRNRLLHYRFPKELCLQFVQVKNLDTLYQRLLDGKPARLQPVPEPDLSQQPPDKAQAPAKRVEAREQARSLGIDTSHELPAPLPDQHPGRSGTRVQTLFYPAELEKRAKKIATAARTAIEETGSNMLYLVFGFLEFYDSDDSDKPLLAPLLSMPVSLHRGEVDPETKVYSHHLEHNGEDVTENFTLREKLAQEFRIQLPEIGDDEGPEACFKAVQETVKTRPRWRIRRQLSLALLSFGKLAIWADLDPAARPALLEHALLRQLFEGGASGGDQAQDDVDHVIDEHPQALLPLVYAADSSQHSALIDAAAGKNMVINGPPGTGKSQTITNIIAAALAQGKRVLFVSEKLAALEVVRQRLDMANLGHFCLELHSHKTQKKKLLDDLRARLGQRFPASGQLDAQSDVLAERKRKLQRHAELMAAKVCNALGLSTHDIFWAAERRRQQLGDCDEALQGIQLPHAPTLSSIDLEHRKALFDDLGLRYRAAHGAGPAHPWHGLPLGPLAPGDETGIRKILEQALAQARLLAAAVAQLEATMPGAQAVDLDGLAAMVPVLETLAPPPANLRPERLATMFGPADPEGHGSRKTIDRMAHALHQIRLRREIQGRALRAGTQPTEADLAQARSALSAGVGPQARSEPLRQLRDRHAALEAAIAVFRAAAETVQPRCVHAAQEHLPGAQQALERLAARHIAQTSLATLKERAQRLGLQARTLREAFDVIAALASRWRLDFDGSASAIASLASAQVAGLLPAAQLGDADRPQAQALAQTAFAGRSIQALEQDRARLGQWISLMERSLGKIERIATETAQPFDGSTQCIGDLRTLAAIAKAAPAPLMSYRRKAFEDPRWPDVIRRAREDHEKESHGRAKLGRDYDIDAILGLEEGALERCARVFRRHGDSVFNVFRSDWRKARKLLAGLALDKTRRSASEWSSDCLRAAEWRGQRRAFLGNAEYRECFGELFAGVDTDFRKIDDLSAWYQSSQSRLLAGGGALADRIDLSNIGQRLIGQCASQAAALDEAAKTLGDLLDAAQSSLPMTLPRPEQVGWHATCATMQACAQTMEQIVSVFKPIASADLTPCRALELLQARRALAQQQQALTQLLHGQEALLAAAGPEFADLAQRSLSPPTWADRLGEIDALIAQLRALLTALQGFVADDICPVDAIALLSAKVALDEASAAITGAAPATQATGWQAHADAAGALAQNTDRLLSLLERFADAEQPAKEVLAAMQAAVEADRALRDFAHDEEFTDLLAQEAAGESTDIAAVDATWHWGAAIAAERLPAVARSALLSDAATRMHRLLREQSALAVRALQASAAAMEGLKDFGAFQWPGWIAQFGGGAARPWALVERLQAALDAAALIQPWSRYLSARQECAESGFSEFIALLENQQLAPEHLSLAFERVFYAALGKEICQQHPELRAFSGDSHDRLRAEYRALDKELIGLSGAKIAQLIARDAKPLPGKSGYKASDWTEMQLLRRELEKKSKHLPIRQLVKRAAQSLQALTPCFMMGPLSVAQYLEQGAIDFDLIVMDEASQLRPEDALGAVARGRQLIVVGDPKQLPPTSFFNRMLGDDDDEDEPAALMEGSESILDICQQLFPVRRTLKWHYRSQHESLIAFSNHHFYQGGLIVFPSPYERGRRSGVSWRFVCDGVYENRRNQPEAARIVDAALEHMRQHPDESLGLVSLNLTQRDLIQDLFDKKARTFAQAQSYQEHWEKQGMPFFIKNLENVQGDERDVIFISSTFAKAPGTSAPRQNFGPISRTDGWRRLNVLFTRSRRRLLLFSSMQPEDIVVDDKSPAGTRALRDYLDYAKRGVLSTNDYGHREPDSDFEISVADLLRSRGYEVQPQLGIAHYFIDLAVRNPDRRGEFLAGIECDGATYHSTPSARDRDRIRQEHLESIGWKGRIWRIWSTDWFYNPALAVDKLLKFLDERRRLSALEAPGPVDEDGEEDCAGDADRQDAMQEAKEEQEAQAAGVESPAEADAFVDLGDSVVYCFLDTPQQRHRVCIVAQALNDGHGVVNEDAPLALALIGLAVGEVGVLRVKGQPERKVRVIKIEHTPSAVTA